MTDYLTDEELILFLEQQEKEHKLSDQKSTVPVKESSKISSSDSSKISTLSKLPVSISNIISRIIDIYCQDKTETDKMIGRYKDRFLLLFDQLSSTECSYIEAPAQENEQMQTILATLIDHFDFKGITLKVNETFVKNKIYRYVIESTNPKALKKILNV